MFTPLAYADEAGSAASPGLSSLNGALGSIATTCTDTLSAVVPIAVPVLGVGLAVMLGIKLFKRITGRA